MADETLDQIPADEALMEVSEITRNDSGVDEQVSPPSNSEGKVTDNQSQQSSLGVIKEESANSPAISNTSNKRSILGYIPGTISIILGIVMLVTQTPDVRIGFGADFYTETYRAIADVAVISKYGFGFVLIAFGIDSLFKSIINRRGH